MTLTPRQAVGLPPMVIGIVIISTAYSTSWYKITGLDIVSDLSTPPTTVDIRVIQKRAASYVVSP